MLNTAAKTRKSPNFRNVQRGPAFLRYMIGTCSKLHWSVKPDKLGIAVDEQVRETASAAFKRLQLPARITLESLVGHVEKIRRRRIVIIESEKLTGKKICGLWIPREHVDVVYHAVTNGILHRQQLILHELSHMILRHDESADATWQGIRVFQELSGEVVAKALARGDFRSELEAAAEHLADLLAAALRESDSEIFRYEAYFE